MTAEEKQEIILATLEALRLHDANNTCMTVEECAEWFGIHRDTVVRRLHTREWKGHLVGRIWRIPKIQFLDKIIANNQTS